MQFRNVTSGGSGANASSYQTASVSPTDRALLFLAVETDIGAGTPGVPEVSGLGATWVEVEDCFYDQAGTTYRLTVFRAFVSDYTTGVITIDYDGVTQGGCTWSLDEALVSISDGIIVQVERSSEPGASATSISLGLPESALEDSGVYAAVSWVAQESATVGNGWEKLGENNHANPAASLVTLFHHDATVNGTLSVSWTTSAPKGAIIVEVRGVTPVTLHAFQDDWTLNSTGDLERSEGTEFTFDYYLTDPAGNRLTDPAGNYLVGHTEETHYPQILHTTQDDWTLHDG